MNKYITFRNTEHSIFLNERDYGILKVFVDESHNVFFNNCGSAGFSEEYFLKNSESFHPYSKILLKVIAPTKKTFAKSFYFECDTKSVIFFNEIDQPKNHFFIEDFVNENEFAINFVQKYIKMNTYEDDVNLFKFAEKIGVCRMLDIIKFLLHKNSIKRNVIKLFLNKYYDHLELKYDFLKLNNIAYLNELIYENIHKENLKIQLNFPDTAQKVPY